MAAPPKFSPPSTFDKRPDPELYGDMVRIKVGKGDGIMRTFSVHEGVICFYSGYFNLAFTGTWDEASAKAIALPTEDPDIFTMFQYWLYTTRFTSQVGDEAAKKLRFLDLFKLWVFGDTHDIPSLQNRALNMIVLKWAVEWKPPFDCIKFVYDNTKADSPLRRLIIDFLAKTSSASLTMKPEHLQFWTPEAMVDMLRITWQPWDYERVGQGPLRSIKLCQYHVHTDGVDCKGEAVQK